MKRLLVIMLILVAVGVVSAATIKIKSDMSFDKCNIQLWVRGEYNLYYPLLPSKFGYNENTREITNLSAGIYHLKIDGLSSIFFRPVCIERWNMYLLEHSYVTITEYFDMSPGDPGTPIIQ
ncbi:MAG: hypothetical protein WC155_05905 [Candidatus Cloacimonadales bacterium]